MDPSFQKEFLRDFTRRNSGPVLALFGKHPAWDDHMDDLGLSTPSLRTTKKLLYLQGIAANAARQQSMPSEAGILPYRHLLLWFRGTEAILLRLVESEDGRGRGFFPLVGAIHFEAATMPAALRLLVPSLLDLTTRIRALSGRKDVADHFHQARSRLEHDFRNLPTDGSGEAATPAEADAVRSALATPGGFVRLRLPVARYDASQTLAALVAACPASSEPVLIGQGDTDPFTTVCQGQPEKADLWFLRETHGG